MYYVHITRKTFVISKYGARIPKMYDSSVIHGQISATPSMSSPTSTNNDDGTAAVTSGMPNVLQQTKMASLMAV